MLGPGGDKRLIFVLVAVYVLTVLVEAGDVEAVFSFVEALATDLYAVDLGFGEE
jgi:hypothetical protein